MLKVSEPLFLGNEKKYLAQCIDEGQVSSGGRFVVEFEEAFARWSGNQFAVAVSSGTAALETAIWALGLKEISIPDGTIISCYLAALRAGAKITLHDNMPQLGNNLMRCHLFGRFDGSLGLKIVDDLSQYWRPYRVKDVGCYSLYANKLITAGEGGVLVTNSEEVYHRAKAYRNLCHTNERFIHDNLGFNFRMSNLQAALALAQLEQINEFVCVKKRNQDIYLDCLPPEAKLFFTDEVPWMYWVRTAQDAGAIVKAMAERDIECRRFFYPLHRQPCINQKGAFPAADDLWEHSLYLPSGLTLTGEDIVRVCTALRDVLRPA